MKIAIVGSRNLWLNNIEDYLPPVNCIDMIISGGARGIDQCGARFARQNNIKIVEFLPQYDKYGRRAPLKRNDIIVDFADEVIAFWDGKSTGTRYVINRCYKLNKKITIHTINKNKKTF